VFADTKVAAPELHRAPTSIIFCYIPQTKDPVKKTNTTISSSFLIRIAKLKTTLKLVRVIEKTKPQTKNKNELKEGKNNNSYCSLSNH